jgi:hypothetical protein
LIKINSELCDLRASAVKSLLFFGYGFITLAPLSPKARTKFFAPFAFFAAILRYKNPPDTHVPGRVFADDE